MHRQAYVLLLLTTLFWGGNSVAGKLAVDHVSPLLLTTLRWGGACLCLYFFGRRKLREDWDLVQQHLFLLSLLGFLGFAAFNLALYTALQFTSAINVSIEQGAMPMLIFFANFLLFGLRVTPGQIAGFVLSLIGVLLTAAHGDLLGLLELKVNVGDALMLLAILAYTIYSVSLRFRPQIHWMSFMIMLSGIACATSAPFAMFELFTGSLIWPDLRGWGVVAYTAIFPSLVGQVFYIRGVEAIGANRAGLFINLVPIFGTMLSIIILGEDFFAYHALAIALVLGGIGLAEYSGKKAAGLTGGETR
jgi:drug/metabolite transporter (DMT)-like permease